tara:strand:- start:5390 stop:6391 length:1002 start_codon:yes stop_codon:yes gene_type:complete
MELSFYILLILIGVITILSENKYVMWLFYIPCLLVFMVVVRTSGFDTDMITYAKEMSSTGNNLYYLREFVFWYSLRFFYSILNNEIAVFLFMDLIWIITLIRASINLSKESVITNKLSVGLIVVLSTSFPLFFGYENIYRQLFATIFSLYAYSIIKISYSRSIFFYIISIFIHNTSIILLPIFAINKLLRFNIYFRILISLTISLLFVFLFNYASQFKSARSTGVDMSMIYLFMFLSSFILYLIKFKFNIIDLFKKTPSLIIIILLMTGLATLKYDMISERLGMMFLVFFLFDLYRYSNSITNYGNRMIFRLFLLITFSVPVLVFSSSRMFLI